MSTDLERECQAVDALLTHLGLEPDRYRTEGGSVNLTKIRAELADRAARAEPAGWQPIETAPKTGRKVILFYLNPSARARTVMARWLTDEQAAETDADGVGLEGGWYECIDNWDDYTQVAIHQGEPAYWMPLPAAPQPGADHE